MLPCMASVPLYSLNGCQIWSAGRSIEFKNKRPLVLQYGICATVSGRNEIWTVTYLISPLPNPNRAVHITHPVMISRFPQTDICSCFHSRFSVSLLTCVGPVHKDSFLKHFQVLTFIHVGSEFQTQIAYSFVDRRITRTLRARPVKRWFSSAISSCLRDDILNDLFV
jgi:hypothetical protein